MSARKGAYPCLSGCVSLEAGTCVDLYAHLAMCCPSVSRTERAPRKSVPTVLLPLFKGHGVHKSAREDGAEGLQYFP